MLQHIFHLARQNGGFTFYGNLSKLPALYYLDFGFVALLCASSAAAFILMLLLPALRRRLITLGLGMSTLWTGAAVGYCLRVPEWQVGGILLPPASSLTYWQPLNITSNYSVGLGLGLHAANITLLALDAPDFFYDETIDLTVSLTRMEGQFKEALRRGLPIPILSIYEQVAASGMLGFSWPFYVRLAAYLCSWMLTFALVLWAYSIVLHCSSLETLSAYYLTAAGIVITCTPGVYYGIIGDNTLRVEGNALPLKMGACFWTCIATGLGTTLLGVILGVFALRWPHRIVTAFSKKIVFKTPSVPKMANVVRIESETPSRLDRGLSHTN